MVNTPKGVVPERSGDMRKRRATPLPQAVDELIASFLRNWERNWQDFSNFTSIERAVIKAHLTGNIMSSYIKSGRITFSRRDLSAAIKHLAMVSQQKLSNNSNSDVASQCFDYVGLYLTGWDKTPQYNQEELSAIRIKLYVSVRDNYQQSGLTQLAFSDTDLADAEEFIVKLRRKKQAEARADERDEKICVLRRRYGALALPVTVLHHPGD